MCPYFQALVHIYCKVLVWHGKLTVMSKKTKNNETESAAITSGQLERLARLIRAAGHSENLHPVQWEALRYLARANQFSNSPGALAKYLGATKGTVSQTVIALVKKGLVAKEARNGDSRSIALQITQNGFETLQRDPLLHLEKSIAALGEKTRKRFAKGVAEILTSEYVRQNEPSFGSCLTCRYFREDGAVSSCMLFMVELKPVMVKLICAHHVSAN